MSEEHCTQKERTVPGPRGLKEPVCMEWSRCGGREILESRERGRSAPEQVAPMCAKAIGQNLQSNSYFFKDY